MTDHSALAKALFLSGMTCSQSVLCAFSDLTGLDRETSMRAAASFGAGMGGLRETCGALSGALMALGLIKGWTQTGDMDAKSAHYARVRAFCERFEAENGSMKCRDLLTGAGVTPQLAPSIRTQSYYKKRPCADICARAARILDEMISGNDVA